MEKLSEQDIDCPYCGETISVFIDSQEAGTQYIEDCQMCCRPIVFQIEDSGYDDAPAVRVYAEDDVF